MSKSDKKAVWISKDAMKTLKIQAAINETTIGEQAEQAIKAAAAKKENATDEK